MRETQQLIAPEVEAHDRNLYLGSSEIAAILGMSPWATAYDVWERKQPGYVGYTSPEQQKRFSRGHRFEPIILDMYQEETGAWITARNARYIDAEYPFLTAEIDAEETDESTGEITNLEIKSVSHFAAADWGEQGTDEVPPYYAAQTMFGLMVSGCSRSKPIALIGLDDLRQYLIPRDEELIAFIREKAVNFWNNHVLTGIPPAIQTQEDAEKMVSRFSGVTVEVTEDVRTALHALAEVKTREKAIVADREALELQIKTHLASGIQGDPGKFAIVDYAGNVLCTWNKQNARRLDQEKVVAKYADCGDCFKTSTFRVLRPKKGL